MNDIARKVGVGDLLIVRSAFGEDIRVRAVSRLEPTHSNGKKIHDFPVVRICAEYAWPDPLDDRVVPWPAEDVLRILELASAPPA